MPSGPILFLIAVTALAMCPAVTVAADSPEQFFESKVRPLLASRCFSCHRDDQKGMLTISSRESLQRGGRSGAAVVPGDPDNSLLIQAVSGTHKRLKMPPGKPLAAREISALREWIQTGAIWPESPRDFFRLRIQPVLVSECLSCHTGKPKGGLRLDSRAGLLKGGSRGPSVVAGEPRNSLLLKAIQHHGNLNMPPRKKLSDRTVADFTQWIQDGVAWDTLKIGSGSGAPTQEQQEFWSYQPIQRPPVPQTVSDSTEWQQTPLDAFVFRRQHEQSLRPGHRASATVLIRRATFDLTGLPPEPSDVAAFQQAFTQDPDQAWQTLIERLLASRHYGERWGRHWLDVVRYADTAGDAGDFPVPEAFKYRNYVIDAFNTDKPYDQFVREQIAGDLLPFKTEEQHWEQTLATGYIAISRRVGVSPHGLRHIMIEDTLNNLGKTFLGLTIGCARCHDHKFDPIPTSDYYALYGIFDSSVFPHAGAEHKPWREDFVYRIGNDKAAEILRDKRRVLEEWNRKERAVFELYRDFQRKPEAELEGTRATAWQAVLATREARRPHAESFPGLETAYAVLDGNPHDVSIQQQGNPKSTGAVVRRGFLQILGGQKLPDKTQGSGRRELADWLTDPRNPLTARVLVNRIWHHHFGRGIVRTTSNFGIRGERPTHPHLLDYLASEFIANGWSIKHLHRLIMSSRTYQLACDDLGKNAQSDPDNHFLWRGNRRRLDAEQIRDSLLAFSGELDLSPGGRHPFDHHLTYFYRQHEPFQETYATNRRSVYLMQQRIQKTPYLDLFDGPDGNVSLPERNATTTTLQALFLMNSRFIHERAAVTARRLLAAATTRQDRIEWACRTIFARSAVAEEIDHAHRYFREARTAGGKAHTEIDAWAGYLRGMVSSNEFLFIE